MDKKRYLEREREERERRERGGRERGERHRDREVRGRREREEGGQTWWSDQEVISEHSSYSTEGCHERDKSTEYNSPQRCN
jgi:hypothetical protein